MDPTTSPYIKVRILAERYRKANPSCIAAVPYDSNSTEGRDSSVISIYLYMHTNGLGITDDLREEARKTLDDYNLKFIDLEREPLGGDFTPRTGKDQRKTAEMAKLGQSIQNAFTIFDNRLNVTAVHPSYKISNGQETDELCVTVFVLGKGKIPVGEKDFEEVERLCGYPFDIVEGYFVPAHFPFLSSKSPLNVGVGIAVRGKSSAGTLGAFLTDEDNSIYLLSCQHTLSDEQNQTLVEQPAEIDYITEKKDLEKKISETRESLREAEREQYKGDKKINRLRSELELDEAKLRHLVNYGSPRYIATYSCGVKENHKDDTLDRSIFVDAGIAILTNGEREDIQKMSNTNSSGKNTNPFNGEIVACDQMDEKAESAKFSKRGRTTGLTSKAILGGTCFCLKNEEGYNREKRFSPLDHAKFEICHKCASKYNSDLANTSVKEIDCATCLNVIYKMEKVNELWAYNCLLLHVPRKTFSDSGDSGAVVYDEEGRAWGIIVGNFYSLNIVFTVACSLDIAIRVLSGKLEKKLRLWVPPKR